ncbi:protein spalt-accessory [Drosophila yakuba]|uniref:Uncharacterized protein n=1 Tax=Drosophila yakuba TaxID=7245 RepID=B4P898_DROYA|nr:protein spalt-accessory [Drosophila yakuba]EDW91138.1 uncharacterized protein Dyak_GE12245 [Drosophila yakuba]
MKLMVVLFALMGMALARPGYDGAATKQWGSGSVPLSSQSGYGAQSTGFVGRQGGYGQPAPLGELGAYGGGQGAYGSTQRGYGASVPQNEYAGGFADQGRLRGYGDAAPQSGYGGGQGAYGRPAAQLGQGYAAGELGTGPHFGQGEFTGGFGHENCNHEHHEHHEHHRHHGHSGHYLPTLGSF